ncbi:hypothetical protein MNBD_ALPHA06-965 [hydrothermal vent metagenome]|uniref:Uncharacterized protein n=1 Tax=hydrothermal vent metagenome TaxID=652676 RepID=A0A3B0R4U3_9ZZZZ
MKKLPILGIALLFASTSPAFAADTCTAPVAPDLPKNGAILNHEQLGEAFAQVQDFDKENRAYKICLDTVITQPSKVSRDKRCHVSL